MLFRSEREMSVKFFGQFLLERGKILKQELLDALEFQKSINVKLGTIALDAGYLSADQVERINLDQQRTDKLFGEIAIELNYLTPEQLEELLVIQKSERISFGDSLVQKGYLSLHDLEEELRAFKKHNEEVTEQAYKAVLQAKSPKIPEVFLDTSIKLLRRIADMNTEIIESHSDPGRIAPYLWNLCQEFYGDLSGMFILSLNDHSLLKISSEMSDENLKTVDEFAKDGAKEFVNILVGNSVSKLGQEGYKINLKPPALFTSIGNLHIETTNAQTISIKLASMDHELQICLIYNLNR